MNQIPNLITFSRILVLGALLWLVTQPWYGAATLAFFAILYGSISDFVDGYLARRYNWISNFGKIMDALVDKVMTIGAFILLYVLGYLQPFGGALLHAAIGVVIALMVLREVGITVLRVVAARRGVVLAAERAGKEKTIWQVTGICVLFAVPMFDVDVRHWLGGADVQLFVDYVWVNGLFYFVLAAWLTIRSGYTYIGKYSWVLLGKPAPAGVQN